MKKIISIAATNDSKEGDVIYALTEAGEIYCGEWKKNVGFVWDKEPLPSLSEGK